MAMGLLGGAMSAEGLILAKASLSDHAKSVLGGELNKLASIQDPAALGKARALWALKVAHEERTGEIQAQWKLKLEQDGAQAQQTNHGLAYQLAYQGQLMQSQQQQYGQGQYGGHGLQGGLHDVFRQNFPNYPQASAPPIPELPETPEAWLRRRVKEVSWRPSAA